MSISKSELSLEEIRREIDALDDDLLALVEHRLSATGKVRSAKTQSGSIALSPWRPAREAMMLRRLIKRGRGAVGPELLVRLWRVILSASTQAQAPVTLHVDAKLASIIDHRVAIAEHFCGMRVETHPDVNEALSTLCDKRGDLAIVQAESAWADWVSQTPAAGVQLIGSLPVIRQAGLPQLLIFGHAEPQSSGDDETVVISRSHDMSSSLPGLKWQVVSGSWTVSAFAGFLLPTEIPLMTAIAEMDAGALLIAGRFPSCIEVVP